MTLPWRDAIRTVLILSACVAAVGCGSSEGEPNAVDPVRVTIGDRTWTAEVAAGRHSRWKGLSGRESLSAQRGMLFVFPSEDVRSFCMRGCSFDIDIAFINARREIVTIHQMKEEPDRLGVVPYSSEVPVKYALEVLGGELGRAGVTVGDRVEIDGNLPVPR
ncbi:MAG: DUF192 domain-containing protein [Planctomycetota bacterium]